MNVAFGEHNSIKIQIDKETQLKFDKVTLESNNLEKLDENQPINQLIDDLTQNKPQNLRTSKINSNNQTKQIIEKFKSRIKN